LIASRSPEALDKIVAPRSSWLVNEVDEEFRLLLGLDQATTAGKLRAIVARAYGRRWRYADRVAATRDAERRAGAHAKVLREALAQLTFGQTFSRVGDWTGRRTLLMCIGNARILASSLMTLIS